MSKKLVNIFLLHFQQALQFRAKNFIWFIQSLVNPFVLMLFWRGAVGKESTIGGWNIGQIQSYYLLTIVALVLLMHSVDVIVARKDIKDGDLSHILLRPFSYLSLRLISEAPERLIQGTYGLFAVIAIPWLRHFTITISSDPTVIFQTIIISVLAYMISFFYRIVVGFIAFWLTDIHSIVEIQEIFAMLFTGVIMPLAFMPDLISKVAHLTPLPYIIYYPVTTLLGMHDSEMIMRIIGVQLLWLIGFMLLYRIMWKNWLKNFTGVGQ